MRPLLRCFTAFALFIALVVLGSSQSFAQSDETSRSSAKITQLLRASGHEFEQKSDTVWAVSYHGKSLKQYRVVIAVENDLMVVFVTVAPKAQLPMTTDFMLTLLRLNNTFDRVKIGLDHDGDLFVREDSSVRILDAQEFKEILDQVSATADETYGDIEDSLNK